VINKKILVGVDELSKAESGNYQYITVHS
jgi:hypothetical protein